MTAMNEMDRNLYNLCVNKDRYTTWTDIAIEMNTRFECNLSSDAYRKRWRRLSSDLYETEDDSDIPQHSNSDELTDIDEKLLELKTERVKLSDVKSQINANIRRMAREDTLKEMAHDAALSIGKNYKLSPTKHVKANGNKDEALLLISDWHYGINVDNIFNKYNVDIARERIKILQDETIKKCLERNITDLTVINLGDLIAGNIHLPLRINSQIDVITQILEVSELYAELLANLSQYFNITEYSVLDNHSRIEPKKENSMQLESLARITPWFLKERLKDCNVKIMDNEVDDNIATFNIKGYNIIGVHGDLDKQSKLVEHLTTFTQQHYDLIVSAHMHHFSMDESNNTLVVCNGSLMATDDYAFKLRLNSEPTQTLIILSDKSPCEEIHRIVLR